MSSATNRRICVISGSRADYGLLKPVMQRIRTTGGLELQLIVTGAHLSATYGNTINEIVQDGFSVDARVDLALGDDGAVGITQAMARALAGTGEALARLQPDLVLVLGDRYEIFAAVAAALVARIPVAHLHGGETTEGAIDEALRHAISKMSHLHFVAAPPYRDRVIQLGEQPHNVFVVGGLGVDAIRQVQLLGRQELEAQLGFRFGARNLLVTFHPATLDKGEAAAQTRELLAALAALEDTQLLFTLPNADPESRGITDLIDGFVASHSNARSYHSLGQRRYLSCLAQVDGVVGNSSSGLLEVPSFHKGTINIGDRQRGRLQAASVINCVPERSAITAALQQLYSAGFTASLASVRNPYGDGGAAERIVQTLASVTLKDLLKKPFHDLPGVIVPQ